MSLILVQLGSSLLRVESEPLYSDFSMYDYTWPSQDAFSDHLVSKTRRLALSVPGLAPDALEQRLRAFPRALDVTTTAVDMAIRGEAWSSATRAAVSAVQQAYLVRYAEPLTTVDVSSVERWFDWESGAFEPEPRVVEQGVVNLDTGQSR